METTAVTGKERTVNGVGTAEQTAGSRPQLSYILITPAHNEEALIAATINSVVSQTVLPIKWVIVDDGSTDSTAAVVRKYLPANRWIELVQVLNRPDRSFSAKVRAFNAGYERIKDMQYDVIGNLDSDISFQPEYLQFLLGKFAADPTLGVAGTIFKEEGYSSERDSFEGQNHVAGGCQLFRKQCFEQIGGFKANKAGGVDWMAVTTARMMGWKTRAFREMSFFHHRRLGTAQLGVVRALFAYGERDYYLGGHPVWEMCRVAYKMTKTPYIIGGLSLGLGYASAMLRRIKRPVSNELMAFHRKEQLRKLKSILKTLLAFKPVDSFTVLQD
jgi:glycosyltransferase involved in cell wall biosynthesis